VTEGDDGANTTTAIAPDSKDQTPWPPVALRGESRSSLAPRTLFATHYHELTELEERLPGRVGNFHVAVREWGEEIIFLHRILPGRTDRSYGVHVAKLAGVPGPVIARAREVLESLAVHHHGPDGVGRAGDRAAERGAGDGQLPLFAPPHPAVEALREIKLDGISPLEAFDALRSLRSMVDGKEAGDA
jgi:DNA mismatch repair protein MutS